jgi:hypothetical protein
MPCAHILLELEQQRSKLQNPTEPQAGAVDASSSVIDLSSLLSPSQYVTKYNSNNVRSYCAQALAAIVNKCQPNTVISHEGESS